jgi:hypothetical protein
VPDFDFRVGFRLPDNDTINSEEEVILVLQESGGRKLRLRSGALGRPLKDHPEAALLGGSYPSFAEARSVGEVAKHALLVWAVQEGIGLDFGECQMRSFITEAGLQMLKASTGRPVRNAIPGIDAYEHQDGLVLIQTSCETTLGKGADMFVKRVGDAFRNCLTLTEKEVLASELYGASFFDVSARSRFITLVTAVEALIEPAARCPQAQALVVTMSDLVCNADLHDSTKQAMLGTLQWLRNDSIGESGRALAKRLLGDQRYMGMDASSFFSRCYDLRSRILHSGKPDKPVLDMTVAAGECCRFVGDLLRASFEFKR